MCQNREGSNRLKFLYCIFSQIGVKSCHKHYQILDYVVKGTESSPLYWRFTMTTISTKIPDTLFLHAKSIAEREEITLDQFIALALTSQISP